MKKIFTILAFLITTTIVAQDTFTQKHSEKLEERATEIAKAYDKQFMLFEKKVEEFLITRNKIENNFTGKTKLAKLYNMQREETAEMADILTQIQLDIYKQIKDDIQPLDEVK